MAQEVRGKLRILQTVLESGGQFSGINRKVQIKPLRWSVGPNAAGAGSLQPQNSVASDGQGGGAAAGAGGTGQLVGGGPSADLGAAQGSTGAGASGGQTRGSDFKWQPAVGVLCGLEGWVCVVALCAGRRVAGARLSGKAARQVDAACARRCRVGWGACEYHSSHATAQHVAAFRRAPCKHVGTAASALVTLGPRA